MPTIVATPASASAPSPARSSLRYRDGQTDNPVGICSLATVTATGLARGHHAHGLAHGPPVLQRLVAVQSPRREWRPSVGCATSQPREPRRKCTISSIARVSRARKPTASPANLSHSCPRDATDLWLLSSSLTPLCHIHAGRVASLLSSRLARAYGFWASPVVPSTWLSMSVSVRSLPWRYTIPGRFLSSTGFRCISVCGRRPRARADRESPFYQRSRESAFVIDVIANDGG